MIFKTKLFDQQSKIDTSEINKWLKENKNIKIFSTNSFSNDAGWGYIILYQEKVKTNEQNDLA
jgi:hypothetical protein